jgi:hypothetical protein
LGLQDTRLRRHGLNCLSAARHNDMTSAFIRARRTMQSHGCAPLSSLSYVASNSTRPADKWPWAHFAVTGCNYLVVGDHVWCMNHWVCVDFGFTRRFKYGKTKILSSFPGTLAFLRFLSSCACDLSCSRSEIPVKSLPLLPPSTLAAMWKKAGSKKATTATTEIVWISKVGSDLFHRISPRVCDPCFLRQMAQYYLEF